MLKNHFSSDKPKRLLGKIITCSILFIAMLGSTISALELTGAITGCHDPSRMVYADSKYWIYSTAENINLFFTL